MADYPLGPHFKRPKGLLAGLPVLAWLVLFVAVVLSFYWTVRTQAAVQSAVMYRRRIRLSLLTDAAMTLNQGLCAMLILCLTFDLPRTYRFTLASSTLLTSLTIYLLIWRSLLLWIDLEWHRRVLSPEWRTILTSPFFNAPLFDPTADQRRSFGGYVYNPEIQRSTTDLHSSQSPNRLLEWVLRNKRKLGSNRNLGFICLSCAFLSWVTMFSLWTVPSDERSLREKRELSEILLMSKVLFYGVPALLLAALQRSMPEFDDVLTIGKEMRRLSIVLLASVMMLTSLSLWRLNIPGDKQSWLHYILQVVEQLVTALANFAACMICTAWVLRSNDRIIRVDLLIQMARRKKVYGKGYDNERIGLQSRRDEIEDDLGSEFYTQVPGTPTLSTNPSAGSGIGISLFGSIMSPSQMGVDMVMDSRTPGMSKSGGIRSVFRGFPKVEPMELGRTPTFLPESDIPNDGSDGDLNDEDEKQSMMDSVGEIPASVMDGSSLCAPIGFGGAINQPLSAKPTTTVITSETQATLGVAGRDNLMETRLLSQQSGRRPMLRKKKSYLSSEVKLEHVLSHIVSLDMFADYLSKELSTSNLLCLIECVQFQNFAVSRMKQRILDTGASMDARDCDDMCRMYKGVQLPIQLPHSFLVFDSSKPWSVRCSEREVSVDSRSVNQSSSNNDRNSSSNYSSSSMMKKSPMLSSMSNSGRFTDTTEASLKSEIERMFKLKKLKLEDEMRLKGRLLYDRYFAENSPLSVQISEESRSTMAGIIGECEFEDWVENGLDLADLLRLFDGPGFTMIRLLRGSFARWRLTQSFQTVYETVDFSMVNPYR